MFSDPPPSVIRHLTEVSPIVELQDDETAATLADHLEPCSSSFTIRACPASVGLRRARVCAADPVGAGSSLRRRFGESELSDGIGSRSATVWFVTTIPQKELRNSVGEVLRRAEAGERFTITVAGRPVAELGPAARRSWVAGPALTTVFDTPVPRTLEEDLERFPGSLVDPFA